MRPPCRRALCDAVEASEPVRPASEAKPVRPTGANQFGEISLVRIETAASKGGGRDSGGRPRSRSRPRASLGRRPSKPDGVRARP